MKQKVYTRSGLKTPIPSIGRFQFPVEMVELNEHFVHSMQFFVQEDSQYFNQSITGNLVTQVFQLREIYFTLVRNDGFRCFNKIPTNIFVLFERALGLDFAQHGIGEARAVNNKIDWNASYFESNNYSQQNDLDIVILINYS